MLLFIGYGLSQIYAGFLGIEHHWGSGWAWGAIVLAFFARISLPLTIGSFFGAMNVWGWHWALAFVFAAPGLAFMIPATIASVFERKS